MIESEVLEARVGDVHVTPEQIADVNLGTYGPDDYVLNMGRQLEAQVVTNNSVRVFDGVMVYGGIRDNISVNKYYDIPIDNGMQGTNRNDIIVRRYVKEEGTNRARAVFAVVKGEPVEGAAIDPDITKTDLRAGALTHDMLLHRVKIEGLNIIAVEPLYDILYNADEIKQKIDSLNSKLSNMCDGGVVSTTIPTNTHSIVRIKFNKTFQKTPAFTCQLRTSQVGADKIIIKSVTSTEAEVYAYSITTSHPAWVHWSAVSLDY